MEAYTAARSRLFASRHTMDLALLLWDLDIIIHVSIHYITGLLILHRGLFHQNLHQSDACSLVDFLSPSSLFILKLLTLQSDSSAVYQISPDNLPVRTHTLKKE